MSSSMLLSGLDMPPRVTSGRPTNEQAEMWIAFTEELMGRGVRTPGELAKLSGVSTATAASWLKRVKERWVSALTDERINWRRETLYSEADAVARAAWVDAMKDDVTPSQKASLYKIILLANQRKASLTGLDNIEVKVKKEIHSHTIVDLVAKVETEHGLQKGALGAIGKHAAKALSGTTLDLPALPPGSDAKIAKVVEAEVLARGDKKA